ncbi:MAG: lipid A export permease/ATP-binding protein MsbA [Sulfuricella sp.]|nr:lipid A export permease/ATP-binding protein MsbA [Sulfuricella sp.]
MTKPELSSKELYFRLLGYVLPYWKVFAVSLLSLVVTAATEPAFPALFKPMLDGSFVNKDRTWITLAPLLLILLFLVRGIASFVGSYTSNWISSRLVLDLRDRMFRKLVSLPTRYYDDNSSGNLIANVAYNVSQVADAGTNVITVVVRDSLTIAGLLGWMFYLNWKLSLIALLVAPVVVSIVALVSRRLRTMSRETQRSMGDVTHVLEETIEGHKVVKIFGGQEYEAKRFFDAINRMRRYAMKQVSAAAINVPTVQLVSAVAMAVIIYIATLQSASNETTVGSFISFIAAMMMLFAPIKRLTGVNEFLQRGLAAAEIVFDLLDQDSEPDEGTLSLQRARGEIELRDLCFAYPHAENRALDGISLAVAAGETVALVGASGSGKTTLANLLPRFYHPSNGKILLDGIDIEQLRLADLRRNIALVSQDVVLFNDTIAANIAYGQEREVGEAQIVAAAEAAHAMEFIRQLPQGLATNIGENGVRLSGGQRQRLAIARAILKDASILILDEATSALDSESERHVQAALETLMQGRTSLVIAHRLSTIEKADRIVVMQRGKIMEIGNHSELLAKDGVYANLHRIQFANNSPDVRSAK